jgi:biotin carboxyl carrier protein
VGDAAAIPFSALPPPPPPPPPGPAPTPTSSAREFSVAVDGEIFEVRVTAKDGGGLAGATVAAAGGGSPAPASDGVKAPMQGLIAKIPVKVGDQVAVGQTVVVLEAMKMQNDIPSEMAGTVTAVLVAEGQVVSRGDVLVQVV